MYVLPSTWHSASQLVVDSRTGLPADKAKEAWVLPIDSIVSGMREYFALRHLRLSRLLPDVLGKQYRASSTGPSAESSQGLTAPVTVEGHLSGDALGLPSKFVDYVHKSFNVAQRVAIGMAAAPETTGFTLVKGPPGTGKTSTLTGILNAIHLREYQKYYKALLACALEEGQGATAAWQRMTQAKPRVLVTAPSNVAVDQVRPSGAVEDCNVLVFCSRGSLNMLKTLRCCRLSLESWKLVSETGKMRCIARILSGLAADKASTCAQSLWTTLVRASFSVFVV